MIAEPSAPGVHWGEHAAGGQRDPFTLVPLHPEFVWATRS